MATAITPALGDSVPETTGSTGSADYLDAHFKAHCTFAFIFLLPNPDCSKSTHLPDKKKLLLCNCERRHCSHRLWELFVSCCLCFSFPSFFSVEIFAIFTPLQQYYINGLLAGSLMLQWEFCQVILLWSAGGSCSHALHGRTCEETPCPPMLCKSKKAEVVPWIPLGGCLPRCRAH